MHWFWFLTGLKVITTCALNIPLSNLKPPLPIPPTSVTYNYSIIPITPASIIQNNVSNVAQFSIAVFESMGHITTDKTYCMHFDYGFSKTLIYKYIVPPFYTPILSDDDLHFLSLAGSTISTNLVALQKSFP